MYLRRGNNTRHVVDYLIAKLHKEQAYIYHSATTGSVYIKFDDERLRSVRVADHPGRDKYKYKWNVRVDAKFSEPWLEVDNGIERYYYPSRCIKELIKDIKHYNGKTPERFICCLNLTKS